MAVIKCANCGAVVNSEAEGCPECGADPRTGEGAVTGLAAVKNCAGCGASVDAGTERCANCGANPRTGMTAAEAAKADHAGAMMAWGGILAVGGLLATLITYSRVSEGGGTYIVAWGPMIFGVILFFMGVMGSVGGKPSQTRGATGRKQNTPDVEQKGMARAGFCRDCQANVWLTPEGTCPQGHPGASISMEYEA